MSPASEPDWAEAAERGYEAMRDLGAPEWPEWETLPKAIRARLASVIRSVEHLRERRARNGPQRRRKALGDRSPTQAPGGVETAPGGG